MPVFEALRLALQTIRTQKLKSGFSLLGVFIGVASLIGAWSIVNGVNRYMTEKFAQTLFGVNTFQLRRRPMFTPNVPDSVWRAWARRPRIVFGAALSPAQNLVNPPGILDAFLVKAQSEPEMRLAMDQAEGIMRSRRHLRPRQDDNFALDTSEGVQRFWAGISRILVVVLPGVVLVSLVIGGIVIMNIMLMAAPRAQRLPQADLARPLRHRHEHDVHDHDAADHQRDQHHPRQHHDEDATDARPEPLHAFGGIEREVVILPRPQMAAAAHDPLGLVHGQAHLGF